MQPSISSDELTVYYVSGDPADNEHFEGEIWTASRPTRNDPFGQAEQLFTAEPGWSLVAPKVSSDGLSLYVQNTDRVRWDADVYVSRRTSVTEPWGEPLPVPELSDPIHWQSRVVNVPEPVSIRLLRIGTARISRGRHGRRRAQHVGHAPHARSTPHATIAVQVAALGLGDTSLAGTARPTCLCG